MALVWKQGSQETMSRPRRRRGVRRRRLRQGPPPDGRLAGPGDVHHREDPDVPGEGHLRPADGRLAVRPRDRSRPRRGTPRTRSPRTSTRSSRSPAASRTRTRRRSRRRSRGFPNAKVQTRQQFIDNQISGLNSILNILYVLLALSVIVSLFGIVNTLVLTVFERTREIGMLRAIGLTRRQTRRMIRHESVITALIGAFVGIVLGLILAGLLIAKVDFLTSRSRPPRSSSSPSPRSSWGSSRRSSRRAERRG